MRQHRLFALWAAITLVGYCATALAGKAPDPATTGQYKVLVRGFWTGQGVATVSANSVRIRATVKDAQGNSGALVTGDLRVSGGHFSGSGRVMGLAMTIEGRVDAADSGSGQQGQGNNGKGKGNGNGNGHRKDSVVTDARISATFVAGGHGGRIAGARS